MRELTDSGLREGEVNTHTHTHTNTLPTDYGGRGESSDVCLSVPHRKIMKT